MTFIMRTEWSWSAEHMLQQWWALQLIQSHKSQMLAKRVQVLEKCDLAVHVIDLSARSPPPKALTHVCCCWSSSSSCCFSSSPSCSFLNLLQPHMNCKTSQSKQAGLVILKPITWYFKRKRQGLMLCMHFDITEMTYERHSAEQIWILAAFNNTSYTFHIDFVLRAELCWHFCPSETAVLRLLSLKKLLKLNINSTTQ